MRTAPPLTPDQRARDLLFEILTPKERQQFIRTTRFEITGSEGGRYLVSTHSDTGNVEPLTKMWVGNGPFRKRQVGPGNKLCAHPDPWLPGGKLPLLDRIATQVLVIKSDEERFLRTAYIYS